MAWKFAFQKWFAPWLLILGFCALQTTVWYQYIGALTPPPFWLLIFFWLSLYRPENTTILYLYFLGLFVTAFTGAPLKMLLLPILCCHLYISFVRERVFWSGSFYFAMLSSSAVFVFHMATLLISRWIEPNPAAWLPLERMMQILWAVPTSFLIYRIMQAWANPMAAETLVDSEAAS